MNITEYIKIKTPLLWVKTNEPERVTGIIAQAAEKDDMLYKIHPLDGLVRWLSSEKKWKQVLAVVERKDPEDGSIFLEEGEITSLQEIIPFLFKEGGILIINNGHMILEMILPVIQASYAQYRDAFLADDYNKLPVQFIFTSVEGPMAEVTEDMKIIDFPLPTEYEIAELAAHIISKTKIENEETQEENLPTVVNTVREIVRASVGMTEQEFMSTAMSSLRENKELDPEYLAKVKLEKFKNNGIMEIKRPKISLDQVGGMDLAKELIEKAVYTWQHPEEAAKYGIRPLNKLLMVGVPGTGKSLICEATAASLGLELAKMSIGQFMSKWIGESESNVRYAFKIIEAMAPLVLWMDEFGRDASNGAYVGDSGTTNRVHGEFLTGLQELNHNVFLMAAANNIDNLPPEMLRAQRFDKIMFVGFPSLEERMEIFNIFLPQETDHEFNVENLAEASDMFTGAEIQSLINEVKFKVGTSEDRHIKTDDLMYALPNMKNRMWIKHKGMIVAMYTKAIEEWDWASSAQLAAAPAIIAGIGTKPNNEGFKVKNKATVATF